MTAKQSHAAVMAEINRLDFKDQLEFFKAKEEVSALLASKGEVGNVILTVLSLELMMREELA